MDSINQHISKFSVVIDTNVLFSAAARDIILRLAHKDTFSVHWSNDILEELDKNLKEKRGLSQKQVDLLKNALSSAFPDACIREINTDPVHMSAEHDRHVVAAAIQSGSEVIITDNIKDFPAKELAHYHIEAQTPDEFLMHHFTLEETKTVQTVQELLNNLQNPSISTTEYLAHLEQIGIVTFANALRNVGLEASAK